MQPRHGWGRKSEFQWCASLGLNFCLKRHEPGVNLMAFSSAVPRKESAWILLREYASGKIIPIQQANMEKAKIWK